MALGKSKPGRSAAIAFVALLALAAGCSSASTYFPLDGGAGDGGSASIVPTSDGGTTKKKDGGSKDASSTDPDPDPEDEDGGPIVTKKDASTPPTSTCAPGSVSGFSPSWTAPATLHQNKCTAANVALAVQCVFDTTANQTTCDAFTQNAANQPCIDCIFTQSGTGTPGPILITNSTGRVNVAGCIARTTNDVSASGCGAKFDASDQCAAYACEPNCTDTTTQQGLADLQQCENDALAGGCATYQTAASCVDTVTQPGQAAEACATGNTFIDLATNVAKLFCAN